MSDEVFQVTLHRTLGRIEGKLDSLAERLDRAQTERDQIFDQLKQLHEEGDELGIRISRLEDSRTRLAGAAAGVGGAMGVGLNALWVWLSTRLGI